MTSYKLHQAALPIFCRNSMGTLVLRHFFPPFMEPVIFFFLGQIYVLCRHRHLAGPKMVSWMVSGAAVPLPGPLIPVAGC